jgi:hypothetical protein
MSDRAVFTVTYDDTLVSPDFMAEKLLELEGVTSVHVEDDTVYEHIEVMNTGTTYTWVTVKRTHLGRNTSWSEIAAASKAGLTAERVATAIGEARGMCQTLMIGCGIADGEDTA